eukprot:Tbor_TRINITY_DN5101_c0_g1::TRINITY_DN5101_c0_g1_i1::g.25986::m.25986/K05016/CLCN7; chloride channel 7
MRMDDLYNDDKNNNYTTTTNNNNNNNKYEPDIITQWDKIITNNNNGKSKLLAKETHISEKILQASDAIPNRLPRHYSNAERVIMQQYESIDAFEPQTTAYQDYLQFSVSEPRWAIWMFVIVVGLLSGFLSVVFVSVLHVFSSMKFHLLEYALLGFPSRSASESKQSFINIITGRSTPLEGIDGIHYTGYGWVLWASFSIICSSVSALILKFVPAAEGVGTSDVLAYLNGVDNISQITMKVFIAKMATTIFTVASGGTTGYYGALIQGGIMIASLTTQRYRRILFPNINIIRCFRNPGDRRIIAVIGAAAGVGSAFSVTLGGLMVVMEQMSQILPMKFALYTFCSCLVSAFTLQIYFSYMNYMVPMDRTGIEPGMVLNDVLNIFDTHVVGNIRAQMNIFDFFPAIIIGVVCGALSALYGRCSWISLRLRRMVQERYWADFKYFQPIFVNFLYVSLTYWIAVLWGSDISATSSNAAVACNYIPPEFQALRTRSMIGLYGATASLCNISPLRHNNNTNTTNNTIINNYIFSHNNSNTGIDIPSNTDGFPRVIPSERIPIMHGFASLSFGFADSTVQQLLSWNTADYINPLTLLVFLIIYFLFAAVSTGMAQNNDVLLPAMVIGATVGRLIGHASRNIFEEISVDTKTWCDPGVFALIGAGSFMGGVT